MGMDANDADLPLVGVMVVSLEQAIAAPLVVGSCGWERASSRSSDQAMETSAETTIA